MSDTHRHTHRHTHTDTLHHRILCALYFILSSTHTHKHTRTRTHTQTHTQTHTHIHSTSTHRSCCQLYIHAAPLSAILCIHKHTPIHTHIHTHPTCNSPVLLSTPQYTPPPCSSLQCEETSSLVTAREAAAREARSVSHLHTMRSSRKSVGCPRVSIESESS